MVVVGKQLATSSLLAALMINKRVALMMMMMMSKKGGGENNERHDASSLVLLSHASELYLAESGGLPAKQKSCSLSVLRRSMTLTESDALYAKEWY